jgi:hypothetical protein
MKNRAAEIRAGLKHPAIDGDGHWLEPVPVFLDYLREAGGAPSVDGMRALWQRAHLWYRSTWSERRHDRTRRSNWWGVTSKTLDKATALLPALLNERLPELGIDFALIYPSLGLAFNGVAQDDLRRAAPRLQQDDGQGCTRVTIRDSSRAPSSSKRLPMSWTWKHDSPPRPDRRFCCA